MTFLEQSRDDSVVVRRRDRDERVFQSLGGEDAVGDQPAECRRVVVSLDVIPAKRVVRNQQNLRRVGVLVLHGHGRELSPVLALVAFLEFSGRLRVLVVVLGPPKDDQLRRRHQNEQAQRNGAKYENPQREQGESSILAESLLTRMFVHFAAMIVQIRKRRFPGLRNSQSVK